MTELLNLSVERHVCPVSNILVILTLPPAPLPIGSGENLKKKTSQQQTDENNTADKTMSLPKIP